MLENRLRDVSECWTPETTEHSMKEKNKLINQNFPASESLITHLLCGTYTAKVKDETIPRVEALPGHRDLCCSDCSPALDLEKPLHSYFIGNHMPEARSHATSLRQKLKGKKKNTLICYTWEVFICPRTEGHQKVAEGANMCRLDFCVSIYPAMHPSFPFLCCLWDTDRNMRSADVLRGFWLVEWRVYFHVYCTSCLPKIIPALGFPTPTMYCPKKYYQIWMNRK